MEIDQNILERLKEQVALKFGTIPKTPTDFNLLASDIYHCSGRTLGVSTLKRIWGYVSAKHGTSYSSLSILCRYLGYSDWDAFYSYASKYNSSAETSGFNSDAIIDSSTLPVGTIIVLKWDVNKFCRIRKFKDPDSFKIEECGNIKLQPGDIGKIESLVMGKPFIMIATMRGGKPIGTYSGGFKQGISSISFVSSSTDIAVLP